MATPAPKVLRRVSLTACGLILFAPLAKTQYWDENWIFDHHAVGADLTNCNEKTVAPVAQYTNAGSSASATIPFSGKPIHCPDMSVTGSIKFTLPDTYPRGGIPSSFVPPVVAESATLTLDAGTNPHNRFIEFAPAIGHSSDAPDCGPNDWGGGRFVLNPNVNGYDVFPGKPLTYTFSVDSTCKARMTGISCGNVDPATGDLLCSLPSRLRVAAENGQEWTLHVLSFYRSRKAGPPGEISLEKSYVSLNGAAGGPAVSQTIKITNTGKGPLNWNSQIYLQEADGQRPAGSGSWLSISPSSGSLAVGESGTFTINGDPAKLSVNTYRAIVTILSPSSYVNQKTINVDFAVLPPGDLSAGDLQGETTVTCSAPKSGPARAPVHSDMVTYTGHLAAESGSSTPAQGRVILTCIPGSSSGSCSVAYDLTVDRGGDWFSIGPAHDTLTATKVLNMSANASKLAPGSYTAQFTIKGSFKSSPMVRQVILDVQPPCNPKLQITDVWPARGATIWAAEVKAPTITATVDYSAPSDTAVAIELVDASGVLLNVGDKSVQVKPGQGTLKLVMSPGPALRTGDKPVPLTFRAVFSTLAQDGSPLKSMTDAPFRSDSITYNLVPAPQLSAAAGCYDGSSFRPAETPYLTELNCWPAMQIATTFAGPKQAQLTIDRAQYFGASARGDDMMPPRNVTPADPPHVFTLSRDTRATTNGPNPNYSDLKAADRVMARLLLHNPDTYQVMVSDPYSVALNRVRIRSCTPDPAKGVLTLNKTDITCDVEFSAWPEGLAFGRGTTLTGAKTSDTINQLRADLAAHTVDRMPNDSFSLDPAAIPLAQPLVMYMLADPNTLQTVAYDYKTYWRVAQSLDDVLGQSGHDKVAQFLGGQVKFLNGLGLPGKLGNVVKQANELCNGADKGISWGNLLANTALTSENKKTDCLTKLIESYNLLSRRSVGKITTAAAAPVTGLMGIASTWAFDTPAARGAGFQADLTLNYSADQLPDHPDFNEARLQIVSYDPDTRVAELLPTTLDTKNKTAAAHLDHLAPFYSLAAVGPMAKTLLRSPLLVAGGNLSSGLALDNVGTGTANVTLAAFAPDGTPLGDPSKPPSLQLAPSAQQGGLASDLFASGTQPVTNSLQVTVDQPSVTGVQILGGAGLLDILPLEAGANDTWVLSLVEQNDLYRTEVHVANNAGYAANVLFDLRAPDGTNAGTYTAELAAKGKLAMDLSAMFPDVPVPFSGYLLISGGQDITAAAVLMSMHALAAIGGKVPPVTAGAGKLYAPLLGGVPYAARLNLVNLGTTNASLVVRAYREDGSEATPAANVTVVALQQYSQDLAQVFGVDPGAVSLVVETSSLAVIGDMVVSDATAQDRYRTSLPLTAAPQTSLVIPYAANDGTNMTTLSVTNPGTTAANAKLSLYTANGSIAAGATLKVPAHGSAVGALGTLLPGAAGVAGGYVTINADQPVTAMALIDPGVHDVAAVVGLPMPGTTPVAAANPAITVAATLDFGNVTVNQSKTLSLGIGNTGGAALTITGLTGLAAPFSLAAALPLTVAPGGQQSIAVTFAPATAGAQNRTLTIASNDPARATVSVSVTGNGTTATITAPAITVAPASLTFGEVAVGQTRDLGVSIGNTGNAALNVTAAAAGSPSFQWISPAAPFTVATGATQPATIRFAPSAAGPQGTNLTIASNDPRSPTLISLAGTGTSVSGGPQISVSPAKLDFGNVVAGTTADLALTVANSGTGALTVTGITSNNARYTLVSPTLPFNVASGGQQSVVIRFAPPGGGSQTGSLILASNDPSNPAWSVALSGNGFLVTVLFSDTFNRPDADRCVTGQADLGLGGSGNYLYLPLFSGSLGTQIVPMGAVIENKMLANNSRDYGGIQITNSTDVCGQARGMSLRQDLTMKLDLQVPADALGHISQAGPYFRARSAAPGDNILASESAGYWVQLHSTGEIKVKQLYSGTAVAVTGRPAVFDGKSTHSLEITFEGDNLQVALDGKLMTFSQNGAKTTTVSISATAGANHSTAGILFGAEDNRNSVGGQHADNLVVSSLKPLTLYPVQSNLP